MKRYLAVLSVVALASVAGSAHATLIYGDRDVYIRQGNPTLNTEGQLLLTGQVNGTDALRSLLAFDLSAYSPGSISVSSASLTLTMNDTDATSVNQTITLALHQLDHSFTTNATWNISSTGTPWTTAGGDFTGGVLATTTGNPASPALTQLVFTSTALNTAIENAAGGNLYLLVKNQTEDSSRRIFRLRNEDVWGTNGGPVLNVTFTVVPEPSTAALFLVAGFMGLVLRRMRRS